MNARFISIKIFTPTTGRCLYSQGEVRRWRLGSQQYIISDPILTCNLSGILLGFIKNIAVAYIHVQINPESGWSRITYLGIIPEFRKQGLGKFVHQHGFKMIKELGGTLYHGGTASTNKAMLSLFNRHNCTEYARMQEWILDLEDLRKESSLPYLPKTLLGCSSDSLLIFQKTGGTGWDLKHRPSAWSRKSRFPKIEPFCPARDCENCD